MSRITISVGILLTVSHNFSCRDPIDRESCCHTRRTAGPVPWKQCPDGAHLPICRHTVRQLRAVQGGALTLITTFYSLIVVVENSLFQSDKKNFLYSLNILIEVPSLQSSKINLPTSVCSTNIFCITELFKHFVLDDGCRKQVMCEKVNQFVLQRVKFPRL